MFRDSAKRTIKTCRLRRTIRTLSQLSWRQKEEFAALIRLEKPLVTNCLLKKQFTYEKSNHTWFCALNRRLDVGLLFQRTGVNHDHDASNHCDYGGTSADRHNNNHNDAPHGRRLLTGNSPAFQPILTIGLVELSPGPAIRHKGGLLLSNPLPCGCGRGRWGDRKR
jgi:hypothetical protein